MRFCIVVLASLAMCCPTAVFAGQEGKTTEKLDFAALYKWFDGLDFDAVRTGRFVKLEMADVGIPTNPPIYRYGFLSGERGRPLCALTINLQHLKQGLKKGDFAGYSPVNLEQFAKQQLPLIRPNDSVVINETAPGSWKTDPPTGSETFDMPPLVSGADATFVIARACEARGLKKLEADYANRLSEPSWESVKDDGSVSEGLPKIKDSVAKSQMREVIKLFEDPQVSWASQGSKYRRISNLFADIKAGDEAEEAADVLASMAQAGVNSPKNVGKIDRLIQALPHENAGSGISNVCEVFSSLGFSDNNSPAHQLAGMRFGAVPALIAALSDRRLTHCTGSYRGSYVLRVGDVVLQILSEIAAHRFDTPSAPMKANEIAKCRSSISNWWVKARRIGELASLALELRSEQNLNAAYKIVERFPTQAPAVIGAVLRERNPILDRPILISALGSNLNAAGVSVLKREALSGPTVQSRVEAADQLHEAAPEFATQALVREWRRFASGEWDKDDFTVFGRDDFIKPLLKCNCASAYKCLGARPADLPTNFSEQLVCAILTDFPPTSPEPGSSDLQRLLASELDNNRRSEMQGSYNGVDLASPEVGDVAALAMSARFPNKYNYKDLKFRALLRRQRAEFKNIWRKSVRLAPLQLPVLDVVPRNPSSGGLVSAVFVNRGSPATKQIARFARAMKNRPLKGNALLELCERVSMLRMPKNRFVNIRVSRDQPGAGIKIRLDLGSQGVPFGSGGVVYKWTNILDGNSIGDVAGVGIDDAFEKERSAVERCLKAPTNKSFELDFVVWPSA